MINIPDPNPDEWLQGYIGRITRMNNMTRKCLSRELHANASSSGRPWTQRNWVFPLAETLGKSVADMMTAHTLEPFLRALYTPLPRGNMPFTDYDFRAIAYAVAAATNGQPSMCASCVQEDIDFWGFSYWRRSHQTPGVRWCMKHQCELIQSTNCIESNMFPEECIDGGPTLPAHQSSPSVRRYADICASLLEMGDRVPVLQARFRMRRRALSLGLRNSTLGNRDMVSDRVVDSFPFPWLVTIFPGIEMKVSGRYFAPLDSVCIGGHKPCSGAGYAVVLSSLYESADEALTDMSRGLTEAEAAEVASLRSPSLNGTRGNWNRYGVPRHLASREALTRSQQL